MVTSNTQRSENNYYYCCFLDVIKQITEIYVKNESVFSNENKKNVKKLF